MFLLMIGYQTKEGIVRHSREVSKESYVELGRVEYLADEAAVALVELAVVALLISLSVGALPVATEQITCWTS